jgi:hypothetical protein
MITSFKIYEKHYMLSNPETKEILNSGFDEETQEYWIENYISNPDSYNDNVYYHIQCNVGYTGVGDGLYLGKDLISLKNFYDNDNEYVTYIFKGKPKWLDLMDYNKYRNFEKDAIQKYSKDEKSFNHMKKYCLDLGYDGIIYFDPQATGEEYVLFNINKLNNVGKITTDLYSDIISE